MESSKEIESPNILKENTIYFDHKVSDKVIADNIFLSNYFFSPFKINNFVFQTPLQYYYSIKFSSLPEVADLIMKNPMKVKQVSKENSALFKQTENVWSQSKYEVMRMALMEKFSQNSKLMLKLKNTKSANLINLDNTSKYWGGSLPNSQNMLGILLMEIREEQLMKSNKEFTFLQSRKFMPLQNEEIEERPQKITSPSKAIPNNNEAKEINMENLNQIKSPKRNLPPMPRNLTKSVEDSFENSPIKKVVEKPPPSQVEISSTETNTKNKSNPQVDIKLDHKNEEGIENAYRAKLHLMDQMDEDLNKEINFQEKEIEDEENVALKLPKKSENANFNDIKNNFSEMDLKELLKYKNQDDLNCINKLLSETSPFLFLEMDDRKLLMSEGYIFTCKKQLMVTGGDSEYNKCCYIVISGDLHILSLDGKFVERVGPNTFFGMDGPLFEIRFNKFLAVKDTALFVINHNTFKKILKPNSMFAINIARNLMIKQNIFNNLNQLKKFFRQSILNDVVNVHTMMDLYKKINSSLHPKCNGSELDIESWLYAIDRLPKNITTTFAFLVTFSKPPDLLSLDILKKVKTKMRPRAIYEMIPGKNLVVLREMETDLMDLMSNMCVHLVETSKLIAKVNSPEQFKNLQESQTDEDTFRILQKLDFSNYEIKGLQKIWPENFTQNIIDLVIHRTDYIIQVRNPSSNLKHDPIEKWTLRLWKSTSKLLNLPDNIVCSDIPDEDFSVDLIQGSRRGFLGVLSPYLYKEKGKIFEWAKSVQLKCVTKKFLCEEDQLMAYSYHYFKEFPEEEKLKNDLEEKCGIMRVEENDLTGISFVIVDAKKLIQKWIDPKIKLKFNSKYHIIINIGYTFGAQSSDIIRALVIVFGKKLKTLNIVGKAGGLIGKKGEILIGTKIISEETMEVTVNHLGDLNCKVLEQEVHTKVYRGPMLTVSGTILQNDILLNFYHKLYGCIGLDMEGFHYSKELKKFKKLGWLRNGLVCIFAYYISELPLEKIDNTNVIPEEEVSFDEGVPSMNALVRHFISRLFKENTNQFN